MPKNGKLIMDFFSAVRRVTGPQTKIIDGNKKLLIDYGLLQCLSPICRKILLSCEEISVLNALKFRAKNKFKLCKVIPMEGEIVELI